MKAHALNYAQRGFPVLPLNGKVPRNTNGCHGATTDADAITRWWGMWPDADIGIATGDGLVVLDVDPRHGGADSLDQLEDEHGIIRTLTARTGGGGLHLYMAGELPSRTGVLPGLDVKAAGGYVVAPPSLQASGRLYEWVPDLPETPQAVPSWLHGVVNPPRPIREAAHTSPRAGDSSPRYVAAAVEAECMAVANAPEGERNHTLNAAAFALARFVPTGEADARELREALHVAASHAGLPRWEIDRTIASAFRARRAAA